MFIARRTFVTMAFVAAMFTCFVSTAQAASTYEYKTIQLKKVNVANSQQLELLLNQLGNEGWLLFQITATGVAILQREK